MSMTDHIAGQMRRRSDTLDNTAVAHPGPVVETAMDRDARTLPVIADPWAHRSQGMRCRTCMYFVEKRSAVEPGAQGKLGRCRRHAPTMGGFPAVFQTDWCGDCKLDETK